jgi:hypothetical protein
MTDCEELIIEYEERGGHKVSDLRKKKKKVNNVINYNTQVHARGRTPTIQYFLKILKNRYID